MHVLVVGRGGRESAIEWACHRHGHTTTVSDPPEAGSCDLGPVECVDGFLAWDRVTDWSRNANPACNETGMFYLARDDGDPDFGSASTGEPRDVMTPPNPCP